MVLFVLKYAWLQYVLDKSSIWLEFWSYRICGYKKSLKFVAMYHHDLLSQKCTLLTIKWPINAYSWSKSTVMRKSDYLQDTDLNFIGNRLWWLTKLNLLLTRLHQHHHILELRMPVSLPDAATKILLIWEEKCTVTLYINYGWARLSNAHSNL